MALRLQLWRRINGCYDGTTVEWGSGGELELLDHGTQRTRLSVMFFQLFLIN